MAVSEEGKKTERAIEDRTIKIQYIQKGNTSAGSMLQVIRNLQNAARTAGGQVLDDSRGDNWYNATLRLTREGKEVWVLVEARSDSYWQSIVKRPRCHTSTPSVT